MGFKKVVDEHGIRLIVRYDQEPSIGIHTCRGFDPRAGSSRFEGRERLRSFEVQSGETALIRTYQHGGLFRRITGGVFFTWPPRPFRELAITEELRRRGIATVEVYGACVEPVWGPLYRGWLVTRELKEAQNLWSAFQSGFVGELGINRVLQAVAKSLRALHREGVYHRDLNLKNILVGKGPDGVLGYIIDFDRAKLFSGSLTRGLANRNLDRLLRSAQKLDPERKYFSVAHWEQLRAFYWQAGRDS